MVEERKKKEKVYVPFFIDCLVVSVRRSHPSRLGKVIPQWKKNKKIFVLGLIFAYWRLFEFLLLS